MSREAEGKAIILPRVSCFHIQHTLSNILHFYFIFDGVYVFGHCARCVRNMGSSPVLVGGLAFS